MDESTALWLLGLAHSEYEAAREELDSADARSKADARRIEKLIAERDALGTEARTLREERDALRNKINDMCCDLDLDKALFDRAQMEAERDAARDELDKLQSVAKGLDIAVGYAHEEMGSMRAELEALKATQPTGWFAVGDWAWANPDGRIVRDYIGHGWLAERGQEIYGAPTAIEAAIAAGWTDFPGVTDHSAGDP